MIKKLYAPWRASYFKEQESERDGLDSCPFCEQAESTDDASHFILKRLNYCFVMLNLYPYNPGHIMVVPYQHGADLNKLSRDTRIELFETINKSVEILQKNFHNPGTNIGLNIGGKAAGGSIADHLHIHVLPRYYGDTSFFTTLADTKVVSADLQKLYSQLKKAFASIHEL